MSFALWVSLALAVAVAAYLFVALLAAEDFS